MIHPNQSQESQPRQSAVRGGVSLLVIALTLIAFGVLYAPVARLLIGQWQSNETYSFGVLVPFISGYLIWVRRDQLRRAQPEVSPWLGGPLIGLAGVLLVLGRLSAIVALQEVSLLLMFAGLLFLFLGRSYLPILAFPILYLFLMLPIWDVLTDRLHYRSQLFSAYLGEQLLLSAGVPVLRSQTYLELPNVTLEVASVCSGVNFLIAVVAVGVPQAYLYLGGLVARSIAVAFAVAVAFLSNGLRVGVIGVLSYYRLSESLHGPGHVLQGLFVSVFGFAALVLCVSVLEKYSPRTSDKSPGSDIGPPRPRMPPTGRLVVAGLNAVAFLGALALFHPETALLANGAATPAVLPLKDWNRLPTPTQARFVQGGESGDRIAQVFEGKPGERVELYIGSLARIGTDRRVEYRSVEWPVNVAPTQLALGSAGDSARAVTVNQASFVSGDRKTLILYWYALSDRATAQRALAKVYASAQLLTGYGAPPRLVVVVTDVPAGDRGEPEFLTRFVLDVTHALSVEGSSVNTEASL